jgi:hypothetical protein
VWARFAIAQEIAPMMSKEKRLIMIIHDDDTEQTFLSDFFIALGSTHPSCPFATRVGAIVVVWGFGTGREKSE